jgi:excisionase family DNA binding protein
VPKLTYSVPEVADLLGISRTSAYEALRRGEIPALTFGPRILVTRATLEHLLGPIPDRSRDVAAAPRQTPSTTPLDDPPASNSTIVPGTVDKSGRGLNRP